ncbi:hypothetical protein [Micromonospora maritima]|uniref:hypothetical protein n=1 Tax=Micromonospora maritima TaxID=986711 RepID=UPI00157BE28A|nr:hypothetical protein [Micromonospora maritima]
MRRRLRVALGVAVAGALVAPATVLGAHLAHPRDVDGYLAYLERYGDPGSDRPVPVLPPAADLVAEGEVACDWMRDQPYALWRTDSRYHFQAVYERYEQHVAGRSPRWGAALPGMTSVATAAWAHLCPAEWELRQPRRRPFAPPPD